MKKNGKLGKLAVLLFLVFGLFLTACGGQSGGSQGQSGSGPTEISIMSIFYSKEPPGEDNVIVKEVEKRTNTKLKITWVSVNNYLDKQNVTLASGNIPDLMFIMDPYAPQIQAMEQQGAFWDIGKMIQSYPNLMRFPQVTWDNIKSPDGNIYGVPRVRPVDNPKIFLRQDWLKKLNLKMPETMDDLYTVMKAFTENDPDGNGKKDTIGLSGYVNANDMGNFQMISDAFTYSNGKYRLDNGRLIDVTLEPEMKDMLKWMNKAFNEGLIPADFALLKPNQAKELVQSEKAGIYSDSMNQSWTIGDDFRKKNPNADLLPLAYLIGPKGNKYMGKESGSFGKFAIPKAVPEDKVKKLLTFMDYGASDEGSELAEYGFKDVHFTEKDGMKFATEQAIKDNVSGDAFGQIFKKFDKYFRAYAPGITKETLDRNKKIIDESEKLSVSRADIGLVSDTNVRLGNEYNKKIQDMKVKVIMGKATLDEWDAFVTQLKNDGEYQKIIKELNDSYQKRNAKK